MEQALAVQPTKLPRLEHTPAVFLKVPEDRNG
jgi:hypothetical protein